MKKITLLSLSLLISFCAYSKSAKVPKQLLGFWQFNVSNSGNWNGPLIGETFVDYQYQIYKVDSVTTITNGHKLWLTSNKTKLNLSLTDLKGRKASLLFSTWKLPQNCTWFKHDPDVTLYGKYEILSKYNKQWVMPTLKPSFFSISKNKVNYLGKDWDLIWMGSYMNREDRALVKHKNTYQLLYIHPSDKNIRIVSQRLNQIFTPIASNPSIYKILGNWINNDTNKWEYGFYENYVIYDRQLWKYEDLTFAKEISASFTNGTSTQRITISLLNDSTAQISSGGIKQTFYRQTGKFKDSKIADKKDFLDSKFSKTDTAIITGIIRNPSSRNPFEIGVQNSITGAQDKFLGDLDSNGVFTIKVPLINTSQVFVDWQRSNVMDVIEPGERYFFFIDQANDIKATMGDNSSFHNELLNYVVYSPFVKSPERHLEVMKMKPAEFLVEKSNDYSKVLTMINDYFNKSPNLSKRFKYFVTEHAKYQIGSNLMQKRFDLDRTNNERFPKEYMEYVNSLYQQQTPIPISLIRDFGTFKTDYYDYYRTNATVSVRYEDALYDLVTKGKIKATGEEKKALAVQQAFNAYLDEDLKDSLELKKRLKDYHSKYAKLANALESRNKSMVANHADVLLGLKSLKHNFSATENIKDETLRNLLATNTFFSYFENQHHTMDAEVLNTYTNKISNPYLVSLIKAKQEKYRDLGKVDIEYTESLKRTDHLKDAKNADSLWSALTKPYLGKVIYVDFWGTWCGPCRDEMTYVADAKKALEGKDVIFMYFANRSPKETWENMIKEYSLSGENVVHYNLPELQQYMLEKRLSISGFPTYMLIDKEGNVKTMSAPRPSNKESLVNTINSLL